MLSRTNLIFVSAYGLISILPLVISDKCFTSPRHPKDPNYYLDNCYWWGSACANGDRTTPDAFCMIKGYAKAASWNCCGAGDTKVLGDSYICSTSCGTFLEICCTDHVPTSNCFYHPKHPSDESSRVDRCLGFGSQCAGSTGTGDRDVPDAFCVSHGYYNALKWEWTMGTDHTMTLGSLEQCSEATCSSMSYICCEKASSAIRIFKKHSKSNVADQYVFLNITVSGAIRCATHCFMHDAICAGYGFNKVSKMCKLYMQPNSFENSIDFDRYE